MKLHQTVLEMENNGPKLHSEMEKHGEVHRLWNKEAAVAVVVAKDLETIREVNVDHQISQIKNVSIVKK